MPVIIGLSPADAMGIIDAEEPGAIHIVQREGVFDPVRPLPGRRGLHDTEPDAPAIREPISPAIVVEEAEKGVVGMAQDPTNRSSQWIV